MMRVVLDANVLVSAIISARGHPAQIIARWQAGDVEVLVSRAILDELERVLQYSRLQRYLPSGLAQRFVRQFEKRAIWVDPQEQLTVITRDPADNRYLECALSGGARYLVSGDEHLLALREYRGIPILSPAEFLIILG